MIIVLHGDNVEASRAELVRLKETMKAHEVREIDGRMADPATLTQALESSSLFGGETLVIIENLFGKLGKKIKLIEELAKLIAQSAELSTVILWENKELGTTAIKNLGPHAKVQLFKTPTVIFQFLDGLRPSGAKSSLTLFHQTVSTEAAEIVFTLLARRVRQLIMLKDNVMPEGLQGWQAGRLTSQAKLFTMEKLLSMHTQLLDVEYALKTGSSPFSLSQLIEQILVEL